MNTRKWIAVMAIVSALAFLSGYLWPRAHYEVRSFRNAMMVCAVDANGNAACARAEGLVPYFPSEFAEFKNGECTDGEGRSWPVRGDGLCYSMDKEQ